MKTAPTLLAVAVLLSATGAAQAALTPTLGGQAVYDDDLNITWLANANLASTNTFGLATGVDLGTDIYGFQSIIYSNGSMNWGGAQKWIAAMNTANHLGYSDWRLPTSSTCYGYFCTNSEMGHLFWNELGGAATSSITWAHNANYSLFNNFYNSYEAASWSWCCLPKAHTYWSGTELNFESAGVFEMGSGWQSGSYKDSSSGMNAWAIRGGQSTTTTTPVPPAAWLLGSGLLGLAGIARRKHKLNE